MLLNSFSILFIDLFIFLLQHFLSNAGDCSDEICMFTSLTIIWPDRGLCGGQLAGLLLLPSGRGGGDGDRAPSNSF